MQTSLWLFLGLVSGLIFIACTRTLSREVERRFLALGLVVAALAYVWFAARGTGASWLTVELIGLLIFSAVAVLGVKHSILWLAVGWAAHPLWDASLHLAGAGAAYTPAWYVPTCIGFDLLVAGYIFISERAAKDQR
jgi:hypothetical protein